MRGITQESTQKDTLLRGFTITNDQNEKLEFIKNPIVTEFPGISSNTDFTESALEKSILSNLPKFLVELGKDYAFAVRQQHIHTEKQDYYVLQPHPKMFRAD